MWGVTASIAQPDSLVAISIHTPRVGSDRGCAKSLAIVNISIHTPRVGSDSKDRQKIISIFGKGELVFLLCAACDPSIPLGGIVQCVRMRPKSVRTCREKAGDLGFAWPMGGSLLMEIRDFG